MAFLVKPASVQKNVAGTFTIDYAELANYAAVPAGYYKNTNNWKEVFVRVKHSNSGQRGSIHFKLPSTVGTLLVSDTSRAGVWGVEKILIRDYDKGEIVLQGAEITDLVNYNFNVVSAATHGDLFVGNGETLVIPSGGKRQYGDFVIEPGGTLKLADGGGITEIEVLGYCKISGTILAKQGYHTSGNWSSVSVLGENLSHTITQKAGGAGGQAEGTSGLVRTPTSGSNYNFSSVGNPSHFLWVNNLDQNRTWCYWAGVEVFNSTPAGQTSVTVGGTTYFRGSLNGSIGNEYWYGVYKEENQNLPGGLGGTDSSGNGGGGGRSSKFGALVGGAASISNAGVGAGQDDPAADEYGENGADALTSSEAGSGGFRGAHGQGLYLKAQKIEGTGSIDASGQKGGDGGAGGEFLSGGELYANGAGGGAAGGSGGHVWIRYKTGNPLITVNVAGGDKGNRGTSSPDAVEAAHGENGDPGTFNMAQF